MTCDLYDIWRIRDRPGIFFCFRGPISQDLLVEICDAVTQKMRLDHADPNTAMRVHAVVVELLQNVLRYSAERSGGADEPRGGLGLGTGVIAIGCRDGRYEVASGNLAADARLGSLRAHLERLRGLDAERLRGLYLERRKAAPESERGAGLGLIDIARKASRPLEYQVHPVGDGHSFFTIRVQI